MTDGTADRLPTHLAATVTKRMRQPYAETALAAGAQLKALTRELDRPTPARPRPA